VLVTQPQSTALRGRIQLFERGDHVLGVRVFYRDRVETMEVDARVVRVAEDGRVGASGAVTDVRPSGAGAIVSVRWDATGQVTEVSPLHLRRVP
jgi:hypothetical protein